MADTLRRMAKLASIRAEATKIHAELDRGRGDYRVFLDNMAENTWSSDPRLRELCREAAEFYRPKGEDLDVLAGELANRLANALATAMEFEPMDLGLE